MAAVHVRLHVHGAFIGHRVPSAAVQGQFQHFQVDGPGGDAVELGLVGGGHHAGIRGGGGGEDDGVAAGVELVFVACHVAGVVDFQLVAAAAVCFAERVDDAFLRRAVHPVELGLVGGGHRPGFRLRGGVGELDVAGEVHFGAVFAELFPLAVGVDVLRVGVAGRAGGVGHEVDLVVLDAFLGQVGDDFVEGEVHVGQGFLGQLPVGAEGGEVHALPAGGLPAAGPGD